MKKRSYFSSLRGKITNRSLLIGLLPIIMIGWSSFYGLQHLTDDATTRLKAGEAELLERVIGANMRATAKRTVQQLDGFLLERIADVKLWANTSIVISASQQAAAEHESIGLHELSIDEVEARFDGDNKSLLISPLATSYIIRQVEDSQHFGEIFFTDRYGFNAALTNPTSDFVQRDENWWKSAWENGISVGQVEFDRSAQIWSVDISVRIDDPRTGNSAGVMKAVLSVSLIQEVADFQGREIDGGSVVIVNDTGLLLADTASSHSQKRIMNRAVNLRTSDDVEYNTIFGDQASGFLLTEKDVIGFARSAGSEFYGDVVQRFQGFNWTAIVRQPNSLALEPVQGLRAIQTEIAESQTQVIYILIGMIVFVLLFSFVMSRVLARSITTPLNQLRDLADEVSKGNTQKSISVRSNDEIMDLAEALDRMRLSIAIMLERARNKTKKQ